MLDQTHSCLGIGTGTIPVAIPDQINRHRIALQYRAAVIVNAVACDHLLPGRSGLLNRAACAVGSEVIIRVMLRIQRLLCGHETDCKNMEQKNQGNSDLTRGKIHFSSTSLNVNLLALSKK